MSLATVTTSPEIEISRWSAHLVPDANRVVVRGFFPDPPRAAALVGRVLALPDYDVCDVLSETLEGFADRHHDLEDALTRHALLALQQAGPLDDGRQAAALDRSRLLLLGAYFTNEYAPESAALTNPSMITHPDQSGLGMGQLRVAVSMRAVGEGHVSSVAFATAILDPVTGVHLDARRTPCVTARHAALEGRPNGTAQNHRRRYRYLAEFPHDTHLTQRILMPFGSGESHGIEDVRFVRFTGDDGVTEFRATYTAFDGHNISLRLLRSVDLTTFQVSTLHGPAAQNKGMALFPRPVAGRQYALCRCDGVSNALSSSTDGEHWGTPVALRGPREAWELVQVGNCGSPVETPAGWLVLTHGVGPMRTYRLGAILLDLDRPERVIATLPGPLLSPRGPERVGYVPNVVYSCGALTHSGSLWVAYGSSDHRTTFASIDLDVLLGRFRDTN
jgi:predicted GH43/DUF377 family glycosyl hydrolase